MKRRDLSNGGNEDKNGRTVGAEEEEKAKGANEGRSGAKEKKKRERKKRDKVMVVENVREHE